MQIELTNTEGSERHLDQLNELPPPAPPTMNGGRTKLVSMGMSVVRSLREVELSGGSCLAAVRGSAKESRRRRRRGTCMASRLMFLYQSNE